MKKKGWIVLGCGLTVLGLLLAGGALAAVGFDFSRLSAGSYVTNTVEVAESFRDIRLQGNTEDMDFVPSGDGTCRVVFHEKEDEPHTARVEDNTLVIENTDRQNQFFIDFGNLAEHPSVTVYLPETAWGALSVQADTGDLKIPGDFTFDSISVKLSTGDVECGASAEGDLAVRTSTGHIRLSGLSAASVRLETSTGTILMKDVSCTGDAEVRVSTGRTELENVTCGNLTSSGSTGSLFLTKVLASGSFSLTRDTGSIRFDGCDAGTILAETDTGSITGTLLTGKEYVTRTDTGRTEVPASVAGGGRCELTSDTGDIRIETAE